MLFETDRKKRFKFKSMDILSNFNRRQDIAITRTIIGNFFITYSKLISIEPQLICEFCHTSSTIKHIVGGVLTIFSNWHRPQHAMYHNRSVRQSQAQIIIAHLNSNGNIMYLKKKKYKFLQISTNFYDLQHIILEYDIFISYSNLIVLSCTTSKYELFENFFLSAPPLHRGTNVQNIIQSPYRFHKFRLYVDLPGHV